MDSTGYGVGHAAKYVPEIVGALRILGRPRGLLCARSKACERTVHRRDEAWHAFAGFTAAFPDQTIPLTQGHVQNRDGSDNRSNDWDKFGEPKDQSEGRWRRYAQEQRPDPQENPDNSHGGHLHAEPKTQSRSTIVQSVSVQSCNSIGTAQVKCTWAAQAPRREPRKLVFHRRAGEPHTGCPLRDKDVDAGIGQVLDRRQSESSLATRIAFEANASMAVATPRT